MPATKVTHNELSDWAYLPACAYSSADTPNFVMNITGDFTSVIRPGDRIKLTQTSAKYFIVHAVGAFSGGVTPVTIFGGTDYTLANAAITDPQFSKRRFPVGFPTDRDKWMYEVSGGNLYEKTSPVSGTWYNSGLSDGKIDLPIGSWELSYKAAFEALANGTQTVYGTLSTANNTESDGKWTTAFEVVSTSMRPFCVGFVSRPITVSVKTTLYLNIKVAGSAIGSSIYIRGDIYTTVLTARSAFY